MCIHSQYVCAMPRYTTDIHIYIPLCVCVHPLWITCNKSTASLSYTPELPWRFHISHDLGHHQNTHVNITEHPLPPTLFYALTLHKHIHTCTDTCINWEEAKDDVVWRCGEKSSLNWKWEWVIYIVLRLPQPLRPRPGHQSPTVSQSAL